MQKIQKAASWLERPLEGLRLRRVVGRTIEARLAPVDHEVAQTRVRRAVCLIGRANRAGTWHTLDLGVCVRKLILELRAPQRLVARRDVRARACAGSRAGIRIRRRIPGVV